MFGAVLVVASAFLAASFAAENADAWMHLATGRALANGSYHLGTDPFAYTTEGAAWVNHAWLYDAASYGVYQALGGSALVIAKAILVALLTALLLTLAWKGTARWLAALAIFLAVAALSPYLLLRPIVLSLLFLGLTYAWLERQAATASQMGAVLTWRRAVPLLAMFALWANMDEWFLLGPALVALWWLGSLATSTDPQQGTPKAPDSDLPRRRLPLLFLAAAGLLAAVVNPHHVRVFTMPELFDAASDHVWIDSAADLALWQSPLEWPRSAETPQRPARIAYAALALVGLGSFAASRGGARLPRLVIFLSFLVSTLLRSGMIPFFAVVAGPIAALNFQETRAWVSAETGRLRSPFVWGLLRLLGVLILAGGALACWTGWVRSLPGQPPRWDLVLDPSLEAAARQIAVWRAEGKLSEKGHGLPTSPAAAYALAWICPAEKSFCDARPHLFAAEIRDDFAALRQTLFGAEPDTAKEWRRLIGKHRFTHLLVDDGDDQRLDIGLRHLFSSRAWTVHYLQGRTTIFAERDQAMALTAPPVDPARRAWEPAAGDLAPVQGPRRDPEPRTWLDAFDKPSPGRHPNRDECLVWRAYFDGQRGPFEQRLRALWDHGMAASMVALPPGGSSWPTLLPGQLLRYACLRYNQSAERTDARSPLAFIALHVFGRFPFRYDDGPPAAAFLAIRAARRALQLAPDDALAHLYLGEAYMRLWRGTRERSFSLDQLQHVRRLQTFTALKHAVELDGTLLAAHELLAGLYQETGDHDFALEHVQAAANLLQARAAAASERGSETLERLSERRKFWQEREKELARVVRDGQVAIAAQNLEGFQRAQFARARGLPGQALLMLLKADAATRGRGGFLLMVELFLEAGRTREVRALLAPELEGVLGAPILQDLRAKLAVASGDYAGAQENLPDPVLLLQVPAWNLTRLSPRVLLGLILGEQLLNAPAGLPHLEAPILMSRLGQLVAPVGAAAENAAVRGVLALEAGEIESARKDFQKTLETFEDAQGAAGLARHYLEKLREGQ